MRRDTPDTIAREMSARAVAAGDPRLIVTFPVPVPKNFSEDEVKGLLEQQGYTRIHAKRGKTIEVVQDRFRMQSVERARVIEALEAALRIGQGRVNVYVATGEAETAPARSSRLAPVWRFSSDLHCPDCDIHYQDPTPSLFSFNSPLGACENVPRLRARDRPRLRPRRARRIEDAARRRGETVADGVVQGMP